MKNVKFINYEAGPYCWCGDVLTVEIEDVIIHFGYHDECDYKRFWSSGGSCGFDADWNAIVETGPWCFDRDDFPRCFDAYFEDICDLFEANVPHGCCGGCL